MKLLGSKAAVYARKSTNQNGVADEAKSVTRQIANARSYAEKKGWTIADEHIYVDDGISGAEFTNRPGFIRLMNALKPAPPFQALIMSEESRLGRETIETAYALKQLITSEVRVFFYLEDRERTLDGPTEKIMLSLATFADELEREKAQQRTYDAMAQKAKAGYVTGGRVFGYDNVPVFLNGIDGTPYRSHVERKINQTESEVVKRIFVLYVQGHGYTRIAKQLNAEHVATPRSQQGRPRGWSPSSIREVLHRPLYRGRVVWNRTKKRNRWGTVQQSARPEQEWIKVEAEGLRIVSDELWQGVEQRLKSVGSRHLRCKDGKLLGRPPGEGAKHLLAGLARCTCGASIEARMRRHGRRRVIFYGCSAYHRKGKSVCNNALTVPAEVLENAVLREVEGVVLDPAVIQAALDRAVERIVGEKGEQRQEELRCEIGSVKAEIERLVDAVAQGGDSLALTAAIFKREARQQELERELERLSARELADWRSEPRVRHDLEERIQDWRGLLRRRAPQGRQILGKLIVGRLLLTPHRGEVTSYYTFTGMGTLAGLLAGVLPHKVASPRGIEPLLPG
jgi:DNA invertase Pin-like site-specific DNA recombinase